MIQWAAADRSGEAPGPRRTNDWLAGKLDEVARILEVQGASPYRVRAYRRGAVEVRRWPEEASHILERDGRAGLEEHPGIGASLSATIAELVRTGRLRMLERLQGELSPEEVFLTLPGIGPELAHRIHHHLGVDTLEDLEAAAWDGRLEEVPGFGPRRVESLRAVLGQRLAGAPWRRRSGPNAPGGPAGRGAEGEPGPGRRPSVLEILSVDREYRAKAADNVLPRIAPRRFNPEGVAWLPILHTERGPWHLQALFSNTARAHRLGRTRDWVVVYYGLDGDEGQATVVTETRGPLEGRRVVRGREDECRTFYRGQGVEDAGSSGPGPVTRPEPEPGPERLLEPEPTLEPEPVPADSRPSPRCRSASR